MSVRVIMLSRVMMSLYVIISSRVIMPSHAIKSSHVMMSLYVIISSHVTMSLYVIISPRVIMPSHATKSSQVVKSLHVIVMMSAHVIRSFRLSFNAFPYCNKAYTSPGTATRRQFIACHDVATFISSAHVVMSLHSSGHHMS